MRENVKHIIFDLGGVLLNIDYQATERAFVALGVTDFGERYSQLKQTTLFDDLEIGKISPEMFFDGIRSIAPLPLSDDQIRAAWNAMLLDFPLRRLQILQQLRIYHNLFLLSNTNIIHQEAFDKILYSVNGIPNIALFFDRAYFSHRVGLRKPMKEIFELVLHENSLLPEETLFIDDSPQHIATADQLGIQTIWLKKGMTIENDVFVRKTVS
jgi:glucose-1-phosphatase